MTVGIISGAGNLPLAAIKSLKDEGKRVVIICVTNTPAEELKTAGDAFHSVNITQPKKVLKVMKSEGVTHVLLIGKVQKEVLFGNLKFDLLAIKILFKLRNNKENTIFNAITNEIEKHGFKVITQSEALKKYTVHEGVITKAKPTKKNMEDVEFAFEMAKILSGADIGQVIVAQKKAVLGAESMGGTNEAIKLGCRFAENNGAVIVKVAKPHQDLRFDMPVIGMGTLQAVQEAGAKVIAVEADMTFIEDFDKCIAFANEHNIAIVGYVYKGNIRGEVDFSHPEDSIHNVSVDAGFLVDETDTDTDADADADETKNSAS